MPIGNNILGGASGQTTGYDIENSLRLNDDDSAYLSFTSSATPTDSTKATLSCWFKLGSGANFSTDMTTWAYRTIVGWGHSTDGRTSIGLHDQSVNGGLPCIAIKSTDSGGSMYFNYLSNAVIRDFSSWYHLVVVWDGSIGTAVNRIKAYLNGTELTWSTSSNSQSDFYISGRGMPVATVGSNYGGSYQGHWDGYIAETHWVDGQACTPEAFAETNSATNQWQAIKYTGSYPGNSFYLKFQDSSALGDDSSGNNNDFTPTNLVATDQVLDSPTNNFATFNPLVRSSSNSNYSEGNLYATDNGSGDWEVRLGTIPLPETGKWYWECRVGNGNAYIGILDEGENITVTNPSGGVIWYGDDGRKRIDGTFGSYGAGYGSANVLGVAVDMDASPRTIEFYKDNTSQGSITITGDCATGTVIPYITSIVQSWINFGQDSSFAGSKTAQGNGGDGEDFYYTPPTGFKALNTDNLPNPSIADPTKHFNTVLYAGDGTTNHAITGVGFQPDLVWYKVRSTTGHNNLYDSVRGVQKVVYSDLTNAEATSTGTQDLYAFGADGFTVGSNFQTICNTSGETFASWNWKAGGTAVSNTDGSITSSVSANTTAGFSIVGYTGTGANATVGHGLSQRPDMVIVKNRSAAGRGFVIWAESFSGSQAIEFDTSGVVTSTTSWNSSLPTSTVINLGTRVGTNESGETFIAYCFANTDMVRVGSYEGNGSTDGTFVALPFKPAFVMTKSSSSTGNWTMLDSAREPTNVASPGRLYADLNNDESDGATYDFVSNGFKCRETGGPNNSGVTYIYLAFAESPFKYSNAR